MTLFYKTSAEIISTGYKLNQHVAIFLEVLKWRVEGLQKRGCDISTTSFQSEGLVLGVYM